MTSLLSSIFYSWLSTLVSLLLNIGEIYVQRKVKSKFKGIEIKNYTGVNYNKLKFLAQIESVIKKLFAQLMLLFLRHIKKSLT